MYGSVVLHGHGQCRKACHDRSIHCNARIKNIYMDVRICGYQHSQGVVEDVWR